MSPRSFVGAVTFLLVGCNADLGVLALPEEAPAPVIVDTRLVVGRTDGPGADEQLVGDTAAAVATRSAGAPGSRVRVYDVDCPPTLVLDETIGELPARPRARERHVEREAARVAESITSALAATRARRRGRCIAETITLAASADAVPNADEIRLVIVSSLLEQSRFARLDRGRLPTLRMLTRRARLQHLLPPGLLAGMTTHIVGRGVPGRVSLSRSESVLELWRGLLDNAGARELLVTSGAPAFDDDSPTEGDEEEEE